MFNIHFLQTNDLIKFYRLYIFLLICNISAFKSTAYNLDIYCDNKDKKAYQL